MLVISKDGMTVKTVVGLSVYPFVVTRDGLAIGGVPQIQKGEYMEEWFRNANAGYGIFEHGIAYPAFATFSNLDDAKIAFKKALDIASKNGTIDFSDIDDL